jgi:hypothetical protein
MRVWMLSTRTSGQVKAPRLAGNAFACRDMWVWMLATRVSGQVKAQEAIDSRAARS